MEQIVNKCKVELYDQGKFKESIDLKKFKTAYVSVSINEDIQKSIEESRQRKIEAERIRLEEKLKAK